MFRSIPIGRIVTRSGRHCQRKLSGQVALTGLQPTGIPHLGNYLGVIKPCVDLKKSGVLSGLLLLIADLHALTSVRSTLLSEAVWDLACVLCACLDEGENPVSSIFPQSSVRGHTELAWILGSCCSISRLAHLPQWRDKSGLYSVHEQAPPPGECKQLFNSASAGACVGLFTYPVLQAADILLYGADVVPIGADQTAHIELARDLVRSATTRWPALASILRIPTGLVLGAPKINSLRNPTKKMSKSDPSEGGCIYLTDSPDQIRLKVRRAQTDSQPGVSYNAEDRPGIANLLRILSALENRPLEAVEEQASLWDKATLKSRVTDALVEELSPIQNRVHELRTTPEGRSEVLSVLNKGCNLAQQIAQSRLNAVYSAIGCGLSDPLSSTGFSERLRR
ncbi:Tryptophan--tRNA ligase, mitochondrial [Clonorchis sinensis]|uniref:Tryptophan--tRNA ligase, mitochondrial n=2 Tax=Clonorchis sinensis TaxID=79923 RepID=A0A8T1MRM8_CLOSI|nr:Tryptophan--tRNA ligase, mitochondrial [Clonorchis sinensis]GAA50940.1 tryptophanyl-tRNA synthetase [Clonorchis sinensis]